MKWISKSKKTHHEESVDQAFEHTATGTWREAGEDMYSSET